MSSFVNVVSDFSTKANFWELNPQLILMQPFHKLYQLDGGAEQSSKFMWAVYFICDPDESVNKFFKFGKEGVQEMLEETYFKEESPDWNNTIYEECLEAYPEMCLTTIQRAFMMKKRALMKRAKYLNEADYNASSMKDLDSAHSKTAKIIEEYDKIEEKFFAELNKARVKGGREESKSERNEI